MKWNEKITISADTPNGVKLASGVIGFRLYGKDIFYFPGESRGVDLSFHGEAFALEVSPGKYLFVLLEHVPRADLRYFPTKTDKDSVRRDAQRLSDNLPALTLNRADYPLLVTFRDISDPSTLERVDLDHFDRQFGPGCQLKSIEVSVSNETVTMGKLHHLLPWLNWIDSARTTLIPNPPSLSNQAVDPEIQYMGTESFVREK